MLLLRKLTAAFLLLALSAFCPSVAWAQSSEATLEEAPPMPTLDQARTAFVEGRELLSQEKWSEAGERFAFAARAKNTPGLRYYVGYCREKEGRLLAALEQYRLAAELLEIEPAGDVQKLVEEAIPRLEKEIPRLVVQGVPEGAKLWIDGAERSVEDHEYQLDPGLHEVLVKASGYHDSRQSVAVKRSSTAVLRMRLKLLPQLLAREEEPSVAEPVTTTPVNHARRAVLWGSVAVGSVGLGLGIAGVVVHGNGQADAEFYGEEANRVGGEEDSSCFAPSTPELVYYCDELSSAVKKQDRGTSLMITGFSLAGVGVLGATLTMLLWPEAGSGDSSSSASGSARIGSVELKRLQLGGFVAGKRDWQLGLSGAF